MHWGFPNNVRNHYQATGRDALNGADLYCRIYCYFNELLNQNQECYDFTTSYITSGSFKYIKAHEDVKKLSFEKLKKSILSFKLVFYTLNYSSWN